MCVTVGKADSPSNSKLLAIAGATATAAILRLQSNTATQKAFRSRGDDWGTQRAMGLVKEVSKMYPLPSRPEVLLSVPLAL